MTNILLSFLEKNKHLIVIAFFSVFMICGLLLVKDYGLSWDEPGQRINGMVAYEYLINGDRAIFTYVNRQYGTVFELPLIFIEKLLDLKTSQQIYFMRHLVTFLFSFIGIVFFYLLCTYQFEDWKYGLLGSAFLILSPRMFAHSFYNTKDYLFMSAFIISAFTLVKFLDSRTVKWAIVHGFTSAFLIDLRILGIMVPGLTCFFVFLELLKNRKDKRHVLHGIRNAALYLATFLFFMVLLWPYLWESPFQMFVESFKHMSHYPWKGPVLFMGEYVRSGEVPWFYIPVWMGITIPELYIAAFCIGIIVFLFQTIKKSARVFGDGRNELMYVMWLFAPLFLVIVLKSVLYDSWRHLFFVYPAILLFSLKGVFETFKSIKKLSNPYFKKTGQIVLIVLLFIGLGSTATFIVSNHPFQNVYFNSFAGKDMQKIKRNYELDYWGNSYKQALEYIVENDSRDNIVVYAATVPGEHNALLLPPKDQERIQFVKTEQQLSQADYFIGTYRWYKNGYPITAPEVFSRSVGNAKIVVVYKLK